MQILSHFLPSPPVPTMEREDYYLTVSRLERAKGIHTILRLFRANGLRLKISGASDGRLPFAEWPSLYRRARATIIPSICHETFGLVVLESLRQQTPVSVTQHGAMLGGELPVQADLSAFQPQTHLKSYLEIIESVRHGQKTHAHV